jgi:hypothetical protein
MNLDELMSIMIDDPPREEASRREIASVSPLVARLDRPVEGRATRRERVALAHAIAPL